MNTKKAKKLLNMFKGHYQMLFSGLFIHTLTGKTRPEVHHFCISRHVMTLGNVTLSKVTKNRQQLARKEVRIIVDFHYVLKIISILPLNHDPSNVILNPFKVFLLPNRLTRLTVLSVGVFPLVISLPN